MKAIIFDFDGVILQSVNIKTEAFASLYSKYGNDVKEAVVAHHLENGGISRFEKFRIYHTEFLNCNITDSEIMELADEFSNLVFDGVCNSPYVSGAELFLEHVKNKYLTFICTGTPQSEILEIVKNKNLSNVFNGVYGSPNDKVSIINDIVASNNLAINDVLFIGDAMTDYKASVQTGIDFVGVKNDDTEFPLGTIEVDSLLEIIKIKNL
jgi:phosphoglycolate phosphatase-like HAD superfamily hydrolase